MNVEPVQDSSRRPPVGNDPARGSLPARGPRSTSLERLGALLRQQGGAIATLVGPAGMVTGSESGPESVGPAQLAASGPRAEGLEDEYELLMEAIYEGYLLHYGTPRVVHPAEADMSLLAGDRLYALGLTRLVALGDMPAVAQLADVIALSALAQSADDKDLAVAVWSAGARAVGWGASENHQRAKALAFAGDPDALEAMRTSSEA